MSKKSTGKKKTISDEEKILGAIDALSHTGGLSSSTALRWFNKNIVGPLIPIGFILFLMSLTAVLFKLSRHSAKIDTERIKATAVSNHILFSMVNRLPDGYTGSPLRVDWFKLDSTSPETEIRTSHRWSRIERVIQQKGKHSNGSIVWRWVKQDDEGKNGDWDYSYQFLERKGTNWNESSWVEVYGEHLVEEE